MPKKEPKVHAHPPKPPASKPIRGTLRSFNVSPKGHLEGAMIETSNGISQVNFPKHGGESFARAHGLTVGAELAVRATLESDDGDHRVYRVVDEPSEARGSIVRLNYALHGEVNGCHLDDGTFVHLKPEGAKRYALKVGETIAAKGERRTGVDANVLEAKAVAKVTERRATSA